MKRILRVSAVAVAAVMLLSACGKKEENHSQNATTTTTGATINYEDYITPVVDRKMIDCISEEQINGLLADYGYSYRIGLQDGYTDSVAMYRSEDGLHTITLTLENMTEEAFAAIATNPNIGWIRLEGFDEAYWNGDQTELIAYQNGYAFSMAVKNMPNAVMVDMAEIVLGNLGE